MVQPPHFDFDLFLAGLNESVIPKQAITEVKDVIIKLAFLYEIDAIQMKIFYTAQLMNKIKSILKPCVKLPGIGIRSNIIVLFPN